MDKLGDDVSFSVILPTIVRVYLDSRDKYSRFRRCNNGLQRQKNFNDYIKTSRNVVKNRQETIVGYSISSI